MKLNDKLYTILKWLTLMKRTPSEYRRERGIPYKI